MSRAYMNILFCGGRSEETLRKTHLVNVGYLVLTSMKKRKSPDIIALTHQHDTCPDGGVKTFSFHSFVIY